MEYWNGQITRSCSGYGVRGLAGRLGLARRRRDVFVQVLHGHGGVERGSDGERALVDLEVRWVHMVDLPRPLVADADAEEGGRDLKKLLFLRLA